MKFTKKLLRGLLLLVMIAALCGGMALPFLAPVQAAPLRAVLPGDVVISEFRFLGPQGGNDEFIELYNPRNYPVDLIGLQVWGSNNVGGTSNRKTLGSVTLQPGQNYLLVHASASAGLLALQDMTYSTGITDDGGIAVTLSDGITVIDAVGLNPGSAYKEGTTLTPLSGTGEQSYGRKNNGCTDTGNNSSDFVFNAGVINPRNFSNSPIPCITVTNVTSATANGTYTTGAFIDVNVVFSGVVNVTGLPILLLETGVTDRSATYLSGGGSNTLTFRYTVVSGDSSSDLDYVSTNALTLNGGTITGAVGDALLILPTPTASCPITIPPTSCSLGANKDILIDNGAAPVINSFKRQSPSASPTNADTLVFRATFSEVVNGVDIADFVISPNVTSPSAPAAVINVLSVNGNIYDVTVSGGDLALFNGVIGLNLSPTASITDLVFVPLAVPATEPATDETYILDNVALGVTIDQASTQSDPATGTPVKFTVIFTKPVVTSTFTISDIIQGGNATGVAWSITNSGDSKTFTLSALSVPGTGIPPLTLIPSMGAGVVSDNAGNSNSQSTSTDNSVIYDASAPPTVTINQASNQADPSSILPIKFAVAFSEPITTSIFTPSDIIQTGTATGITWSITNSGDNQNFTLNATAVTGKGTLIPIIPANSVTDLTGNINVASTSTDNSVTYVSIVTPTQTPTSRPTATRTPVPPPPPELVAINEFVPRPGRDWNNDGVINTGDEFIEIINHGTISVNLGGYSLDDEVNLGSGIYSLPSVTLSPGQRIVFYGSQTNILLSDGGDGVRLLKPNGQLMDAFNYTVVNFPDQSFCRLPDNGGLDDWNNNCFPTPGLRNNRNADVSGSARGDGEEPLCPIADTLPQGFFLAECNPFGLTIWNRPYWDDTGWFGEQELPDNPGTFVD